MCQFQGVEVDCFMSLCQVYCMMLEYVLNILIVSFFVCCVAAYSLSWSV